MSYLLQITTGPIQGFIATARRTRDLWFGSWVLSELSKSVAASLHTSGAELIFPAPANVVEDLEPESEFLVVNIIVAQVNCADDAALVRIADTALTAARARWSGLCRQAWKEADEVARGAGLSGAEQLLRRGVWQAQEHDVLEIYWSAAPIRNGDYAFASDAMRSAMAMRKNCRNAAPYQDSSALPKSSLDGMQSSVFQEVAPKARDGVKNRFLRARQRLGVEASEQLDLASFVKRVMGRERAFVPVARIAADGWLQKVSAMEQSPQAENRLEKVRLTCEALKSSGLVTALYKTRQDRYRDYKVVEGFTYDGQHLYPARLEADLQTQQQAANDADAADDRDDAQTAANNLTALQRVLTPLWRDYGTPCPYYAILFADGDRMGELIDATKRQGAHAHRVVSGALSQFAQQVPECLNTDELRGAATYSGGDDVLAFVRLDRAIACAKQLAELFCTSLAKALSQLQLNLEKPPTLSVGLAIGHVLEPLGDVRALAQRAEQLAKGALLSKDRQNERRNGLGILIKPRSGGEYSTRMQWSDGAALKRLGQWQSGFENGDIPTGLPYELRQAWEQQVRDVFANENDAKALWQHELALILSKKPDLTDELRRQLFEQLSELPVPDGIDQLLVARWLSGQRLEDRA